MILVDTSVWVDHLRTSDPALVRLLEDALVSVHPMVIGEIALGSLQHRGEVLSLLTWLPAVRTATHVEVLALVEAHALHGTGLSLVDVHLLAAALLTPDTALWTRDRRLHAAAERLGCAAGP